MAEWIVSYIRDTLSGRDRFTLALSGGSTPKKLYRTLASDDFKYRVDWEKVHLFWGDERFLPPENADNNARMAFDELLLHVPVITSNLHPIRTDIPPEESAKEYEKLLHRYFKGNESFDLTLCGLGDNAHTLSLFPAYPIVHEKNKWVDSFFLKEQNMYRISLTAPVVNLSRKVAYLVSGEDKADAVLQVIRGNYVPDLYPAQVIKPLNGELYWFIDQLAAQRLPK